MKKCIPGGSGIPMPGRISTPSELGRFSDQIIKALTALRDRPYNAPTPPPRVSPRRPFHVRPNGDDTVNVNAGKVLYWSTTTSGSFPNEPFELTHEDYASSDVTITGDGTLKIVIDATSVEVSDDGIVWHFVYGVDTMDVELNPTLSGAQLSIPIASVSLSDGVAAVTSQIIDYNPIIQLQYAIDRGPF